MNLKKIEDLALHLPRQEREKLAQRLILSLDDPSADELRAEWLEEAKNRAEELDRGSVKPASAEEVSNKPRLRLSNTVTHYSEPYRSIAEDDWEVLQGRKD